MNNNKPNDWYSDMISADLVNIKREADRGCKSFLIFVNAHYVPPDRKIDLSENELQQSNLKRLITTKFAKIFHPDKNRNEPRQVQMLREEI